MAAKIASVHFAALHATRQGKVFVTQPVKLGGDPFIINVEDDIQIERGPYMESIDKKRRSTHKYPVTGFDRANDIVKEWAHSGLGMNPTCRPGVWVVRELLPVLNELGQQEMDADNIGLTRLAEREEMRQMFEEDLIANRAADVEYARWLIGEGNAQAQDPRLIRFIPSKAKLAVEHLGMTTEWMKPGAGALEMKSCIYCSSIIVKRAVICPKCQQVVDAGEFARLKLEQQKKGAAAENVAKAS
jgi:hypothetical protein